MEKSNLWILTEERPKKEVLLIIIDLVKDKLNITINSSSLSIHPEYLDDKFIFRYRINGIESDIFDGIYLKLVSGFTSFVDHMVFNCIHEPSNDDVPLFLIEETKTDDSESRNTGIYQRGTKFSYLRQFYDSVELIMLYNLQGDQKPWASDSNIFGTRCFLTQGVKFVGKKLGSEMRKWNSIDELINFKSKMRKPPKRNTPIEIFRDDDRITISGKLEKKGNLGSDPSIGTLLLISQTLRDLGYKDRIIITKHGLTQKMLTPRNKFIRVANQLGIELENLIVPKSKKLDYYWKYTAVGEKIGSIFLHLILEEYGNGKVLYENHAGSERGYFKTKLNKNLAVAKYKDTAKYKAGDKSQIIALPDLVYYDYDSEEILNIEGEQTKNAGNGVEQLNGFGGIEDFYINKYYPNKKILRTVTLNGGTQTELPNIPEITFLLNNEGGIFTNSFTHSSILNAIKKSKKEIL